MSEIETLINDQKKEIDSLNLKIKELEAHVKDFEKIAHVWKNSYEEMDVQYKVKLANTQLVIKELQEELDNVRYGD